MDKTNTWLIGLFAVVLICFSLFAYLNAQANQSLLRVEDLDYKAVLLRPKPSIEDLEYKALDKKRANAEYAANRDLLTMKNLEVFFFVILHSIVVLKQQPILHKWNYIFLGKKQIYQNGILLSKIMKTKNQNVKTFIL